MFGKPLFVEVLLPVPLPGTLCYAVPDEFLEMVSPGVRVVVQFGRNKVYTALIKEIHTNTPVGFIPKPIISVLDDMAVVSQVQLEFWDWMAQYYMCTSGEVMNAALPSTMKLASESKVLLKRNQEITIEDFNEKEQLIINALIHQDYLTIDQICSLLSQKKVFPIIKTLLEKDIVEVVEELNEKFKPKIEKFIKLNPAYDDEEKLQELFDSLGKRAVKQLDMLMMFVHLTHHMQEKIISVKEFLKYFPSANATLQGLVKKRVFELNEVIVSRLKFEDGSGKPEDIILNEEQSGAFSSIKNQLNDKEVVLLHGVTSSGKTEIYIKLMDEVVKQGRQVLYLLPEIALTTQTIGRLQKYFGTGVGVYHSRYNEQERTEIWRNIQLSQQIVIGARSALFLPFRDLGLVIVDEEGDSSYKQQDPAPRYHARDAAIVLAHKHKAKVLLGSATPSVESYFNARTGKYGLVEIFNRYGGLMLPEVQVVDIIDEMRHKRMKSHFSSVLIEHMQEALNNGEQVILFQNRRGFSLRLECDQCHWIPECKNCDVTLTYHKKNNELRCHYCGFVRTVPSKCPACGGSQIRMRGFGTEKIEDELPSFFPDYKIARMDFDTMRTRNAHQQVINDFEEKRIQILVGTQMVTKGLDFENVSLVGILNADNMLNFPDFRAFERSYMLMAQVSGRAGRKSKRGKVIIQTYNPYHSVIQQVINNDYSGMVNEQLIERKQFKYPPYYRLIKLMLKHKDEKVLNGASNLLAKNLKRIFGDLVLGPEFPLVSRISNYYLKQIMVKADRTGSISDAKNELRKVLAEFQSLPEYRSVRIIVDVDPF